MNIHTDQSKRQSFTIAVKTPRKATWDRWEYSHPIMVEKWDRAMRTAVPVYKISAVKKISLAEGVLMVRMGKAASSNKWAYILTNAL